MIAIPQYNQIQNRTYINEIYRRTSSKQHEVERTFHTLSSIHLISYHQLRNIRSFSFVVMFS